MLYACLLYTSPSPRDTPISTPSVSSAASDVYKRQHIATVMNDTMLLFDGGWQSNTTKSRLNALCYEFATGFSVIQRNWDWFVADFHGNRQDFADGFELAIS